MLPEILDKNIKLNNFLTDWQTVILRNYGLVPAGRIAEILHTDEKTIRENAELLGIDGIVFSELFKERGYITVIRNNWHILSYDQLTKILGMTEKELEFTLKEDDFLDVKLGCFKPQVKPPVYSPLSKEELENTLKAKKIIEECFVPYKKRPFDFYSEISPAALSSASFYAGAKKGKVPDKIVYSYSSVYGDCLLNDGIDNFPEKLLEAYKAAGVNGIWFQGLLSTLSYYPFKPDEKDLYKIRRKNLQKIIDKCARYGIRVFLYFNEPRPLEDKWFDSHEELRGHSLDGYTALCSSTEVPYKYLYDATRDLFENVHGLGGLITITMSENTTNCCCHGDGKCPRCEKNGIKGYQVVSRVNNALSRAIRDSGDKDALLIANIWGWNGFFGWNTEVAKRAVDLLDKDIIVMAVSEDHLKIEKGGIKNVVVDYSVSNPGPGEFSKAILSYARKTGHRIYAKIQVNNSWECASVPYLPVFDLFAGHVSKLMENGVEGYMLCWTLGGYPSPALCLVSYILSGGKLDDWYGEVFKKDAGKVHEGIRNICDGFREFPFDVSVLYFACQNMGANTLLSLEKTGLESSMVCYPYDDIEKWKGVYTNEVFVSQLEKLSKKWSSGLNILREIQGGGPLLIEICRMAEAGLICFESLLNEFKFNLLKADLNKNKAELAGLLDKERRLAYRLMELQSEDCRIGFEASNHYFYNQNSLLEKLLNVKYLEEKLKKI